MYINYKNVAIIYTFVVKLVTSDLFKKIWGNSRFIAVPA
ncbi:hypothetical protein D1AOALGA4SA_6943 [Olavius algarvensis Delta 1 endosymbiont]|nr:hypothetical protein D1AOALGA4SA_6943 [Olavius algarvensis Delta 1 endosymbiont]